MGERSVQLKGVGKRGYTGGKEERENSAQGEEGRGGSLVPKAARRQDRRLAQSDEGA